VTEEHLSADDRQAIADVQIRYATACDRRDWALFDHVFVPDVLADYGEGFRFEGREAVVASIRSMLGGCGSSQHLLGNHRAAHDGTQVVASCTIRAFHRGRGDASASTYEALGEYHDTVVRTAEGWRIAVRRMDVIAELGSREVLGPG
jgi:3-phenylpropionate/cinnamic acid dioxygenase small subunit